MYIKISIISWIFCILMFLIISFRKMFMNIVLVPFFELYGHEHKFET